MSKPRPAWLGLTIVQAVAALHGEMLSLSRFACTSRGTSTALCAVLMRLCPLKQAGIPVTLTRAGGRHLVQ